MGLYSLDKLVDDYRAAILVQDYSKPDSIDNYRRVSLARHSVVTAVFDLPPVKAARFGEYWGLLAQVLEDQKEWMQFCGIDKLSGPRSEMRRLADSLGLKGHCDPAVNQDFWAS